MAHDSVRDDEEQIVSSEALDDVLETSVDSIEAMLSLRESLNELLETGLLELARARYASGNQWAVSALQLNMGDMRAARTVSSTRPDDGYHRFELLFDDNRQPTEDDSSGARRRRAADRDKVEEEEEQPPTPRAGDPLKWFGVLVPSSLRRSQKCFATALEILTDVATEQSKLATSLTRYEQLRSRK